MVSFVNKNKISLEPAKHINDRVVKLLHKAAGARESDIQNITRRSKIESIGIIVSQNYPITITSTTKTTNQITIITFCTAKTPNQITITGFCMHLTRAFTD